MLKYEIPVSLEQFKETFNQFFYLSGGNENLKICVPAWFVQLNESKEFEGNFIG